ncbi:hypothetical protein BS329_12810 [Amycolatopsis coloradensis]|uniref:FAD/NAD(P)-binding domain-containing protein n=1 Tax=Amycolatopsis coloradensis TaxID=76021 RepID=A0A1R0KXC1_9PSEU|nr:hypothetical protein BS329_12810 [Amycolatopsis coloradensis]
MNGVHTLRTLEDAVGLKRDLAPGPSSVVVIGTGLIGAEVASACRLLGHEVTVIEAMPVPRPGRRPGNGHGVRWSARGKRRPADLVIAGVGARPVTEWLTGSGLAADDGVLVDSGCVTANPRVIAVGDVARYHRRPRGRRIRAEHWTAAGEQVGVAARTCSPVRPSRVSHDTVTFGPISTDTGSSSPEWPPKTCGSSKAKAR